MLTVREIEILLVEPETADGLRAAAIFKRAKVRNHVTTVPDAQSALAHLRREGSHYRSPRPNLILLNADTLPHRGEELLSAIKADRNLMHIPVLVLGNSGSDLDVARAYDLDANCYVQRPLSEEAVERLLETIREFWLTIVKLPAE